MGKAEDERLQRYFDGELSAEERARVEAVLTDEDRLKLAALAEVRGLVASALTAEAADVDLWPALEKQLGAAGGGGRVGKAESRARRRWGLGAHPYSWSSGFAAAAAAALLLILQPWHAAHAQNGCEIESLEADQMATVMNVDGAHGSKDEPTTVIWTMEDD